MNRRALIDYIRLFLFKKFLKESYLMIIQTYLMIDQKREIINWVEMHPKNYLMNLIKISFQLNLVFNLKLLK